MEITFYLCLRCMVDEYMETIVGVAKKSPCRHRASNSCTRLNPSRMLYSCNAFGPVSADPTTLSNLQPLSDDIMDPDRKFVIVLRRLGIRSRLWSCRCNLRAAKSSWHGRDNPTGRDRNLDILGGCGNHLRWQVRNLDAFCFVVVAGRDDL